VLNRIKIGLIGLSARTQRMDTAYGTLFRR
jgi:hypothetical protein